jgi:hypothetical protein
MKKTKTTRIAVAALTGLTGWIVGTGLLSAAPSGGGAPFAGAQAEPVAEARDVLRKVRFVNLSLSASAWISTFPGGGVEAIRQVLALESRATSVSDAIAIKRSGLQHAGNLHEYLLLCSSAFSSPTDAYRAAASEFAAANLEGHIGPGDSIEDLLALESRATAIDHAVAIKRTGMSLALDLEAFARLSRSAFANPSDGYLAEVSAFIAANVGRALSPGSDLRTLVSVESRCTRIDDAIAVKRAGLAVVRSVEDFAALSRPAFSNPTAGYSQGISAFIAANVGRAVQPGSCIKTLLQIESLTTTISDAMAVKRAGLAAVRSSAEFLALTRPAFSNPTSGYESALSQFIAQHSAQFMRG